MLGYRERDARREDEKNDKGLRAETPEHAGSLRVAGDRQVEIDSAPREDFGIGLDSDIA